MAKNYKIDTEKEIITVDLENLTDAETKEVKKLKALGYKVLPKRTIDKKIPKKEDIVKWLKDNATKEDVKTFEAEGEKKITDKNGKERKAGYLVAMKWFRTTFPNAYDEIKANL